MANSDLLDFFEEKTSITDRQGLGDALDRVLTGPQQETLLEALAADTVDVVPVVGDAMALSRQKRAEELGITYPDRPAVIENALSDLPPPVDTIFDIIIAQNTMSYLENEKGIPVATAFKNAADEGAESVNEFVDGMLNTGQ